MMRSLYTAATGMEAQRLNIDVVANNLANVNTTGFKRSRADFQDLLYQDEKTAGASAAEGLQIPSGIQVGLGVRPVAVQKIFEQGDFASTGNPLDLVIEGNGFFQVPKPDGELAYTRSGAFKLDSTGRVVTSDGYPIEPTITIPTNTTSITIGADGKITVTQPGSNTPTGSRHASRSPASRTPEASSPSAGTSSPRPTRPGRRSPGTPASTVWARSARGSSN